MEKLRKIFIVACVLLVISSATVLAYTTWTKTFTWKKPSLGFEVYRDLDHTQPWEADNEALGVISDPTTKTFYIVNIGNLPVRVSIIDETIIGASPSWTPSVKYIDLDVGADGTMTLTLSTFTQSECSYTFTFTAS